MKTFDPFSTTNALYGKFYSRKIPYTPPGPSYSKPTMEDDFRRTTLQMRQNYFDPFSHLHKGMMSEPPTESITQSLMNQTSSYFNRMNKQVETRRWLQKKYMQPIPNQYYNGYKVPPMAPYRPPTPPYKKDTFTGIPQKREHDPETTYQVSYQWRQPLRFGMENFRSERNFDGDNSSFQRSGNVGGMQSGGTPRENMHERIQSAMPSYSNMARMAQFGNTFDNKQPTPKRVGTPEHNSGTQAIPQEEISQQQSQTINIDKVSTSKVGLQNTQSDCFLNSIIQVLIHCPPLIYTFLSESNNKMDKNQIGPITSSFTELLLNFSCCPDFQSFTSSHFRSAFVSLHPSFSKKDNDSHEFLRFLLQDLNNELNRVSQKMPIRSSIPQSSKMEMFNEYRRDCISKEDSIITDLFVGYMSFEFKCNCGSRDFAFGQFLDLPLLFDNDNVYQYDINDLIGKNILRDEIIKVNDYCRACGKIFDRQQKIRIGSLPQLLMLSIQRINPGNLNKNNSRVQFEETLNMRNYVDDDIFDGKSTSFRLWGIVCHKGNFQGGHYFCYVKINGIWFCFDDDNVSEKNPEFNSSDVYSLFYTRVNN